MNPKPVLKWLALLATSAALTLVTADAKPEKDKDKDKSEDKADKAADKAEKKADKAWDKAEKHADKSGRKVFKKGEFKERFQDRDRDRIVTYFSEFKGREHGLPPGLAKNWESGRRLPPGWRDRVVTGYVIEDDWLPAFHPVPYSWFPDVVVVPDTRLYWYGDRVVRVYEPTREVVDVVIVPTIHIDL